MEKRRRGSDSNSNRITKKVSVFFFWGGGGWVRVRVRVCVWFVMPFDSPPLGRAFGFRDLVLGRAVVP